MAVGLRDRMRQHRRVRAKGTESVFGGKGKPAHQLIAQLRLGRTEDDQIIVVRLVWRRAVDRKVSIRVRKYHGHALTLPGEPRLAVLLEENDPNRRARYRSREWVEGQTRAVLSHKNGNVWQLFKRKVKESNELIRAKRRGR